MFVHLQAQPAAAAPLQEGQQPAAPWPATPPIAPAAAPAEGAAPLQQQPPLQPPPAPAHAAAEEPMAAAAALSSMDPEELPEEVVQQAIPNEPPPDVHIVASAAEARRVASALLALPPAELEGMVFGCDTEVMDIDIRCAMAVPGPASYMVAGCAAPHADCAARSVKCGSYTSAAWPGQASVCGHGEPTCSGCARQPRRLFAPPNSLPQTSPPARPPGALQRSLALLPRAGHLSLHLLRPGAPLGP